MDNTKLAWLAGIVDGEGSIGVYLTKTSQKKKYGIKLDSFHVVYQFTIANTNTLIINEAHQLVSEILGNMPTTAIQVVTDKRERYKNSRVGYCVNVKDHKGIVRVLSAIEPYLVGKKSQAQVMLQLLNNHRRHTPYTKVELQVIELLKQMKKHNTTFSDEDNTEPSRELLDSQACVEHIETTTQQSMKFVS